MTPDSTTTWHHAVNIVHRSQISSSERKMIAAPSALFCPWFLSTSHTPIHFKMTQGIELTVFPFVSLRFRSIGTSSWIPGFLLFQFSPEELQDWSLTKLGRMAGPKMEKLDTKIWVKNPKLLGSLLRGWLSWVSFHSCVPFYPWFPVVLVMQLRSRYDDFVVENWKNCRLLHFCGWLWEFASRNFGTLQGHKHRQDAGTCSFGVHWLSKASIVTKGMEWRQSWQSFFEIWISISSKHSISSKQMTSRHFCRWILKPFRALCLDAQIFQRRFSTRVLCTDPVAAQKSGTRWVALFYHKGLRQMFWKIRELPRRGAKIYRCEGNQTKHDLNSKVGVWSRSKKGWRQLCFFNTSI